VALPFRTGDSSSLSVHRSVICGFFNWGVGDSAAIWVDERRFRSGSCVSEAVAAFVATLASAPYQY